MATEEGPKRITQPPLTSSAIRRYVDNALKPGKPLSTPTGAKGLLTRMFRIFEIKLGVTGSKREANIDAFVRRERNGNPDGPMLAASAVRRDLNNGTITWPLLLKNLRVHDVVDLRLKMTAITKDGQEVEVEVSAKLSAGTTEDADDPAAPDI